MAGKNNPKKQSPQKEKKSSTKPIEGFNIHIDDFGVITMSESRDEVNRFLTENLPDKKFEEK